MNDFETHPVGTAERIKRLEVEREKWCHHAAFYCHGHAKTIGSDFDEAWADYQNYISDDEVCVQR